MKGQYVQFDDGGSLLGLISSRNLIPIATHVLACVG